MRTITESIADIRSSCRSYRGEQYPTPH